MYVAYVINYGGIQIDNMINIEIAADVLDGGLLIERRQQSRIGGVTSGGK